MTRVSVPGRVNLIGEWIDFNGGTVLPMTLPQSVELEMTANDCGFDRVTSAQFPDTAEFGLDAPAAGHWSDYVRGGLQYARRRDWICGGQDVVVTSTIPVGAGLSSSAATVVATLKAAGADIPDLDPSAIAFAAKAVENDFIGVPCGIMDQMAVAVGTRGHALALDTRDCSYELIPVPAGWSFAVIHSGISRALADGRYRRRREECLQAAAALGTAYLCEGDPRLARGLPAHLAKRAHHAISEARRSLEAAAALRTCDLPAFGALMNASHASLRDDFDVSVPAMDAMVRDAVDLGGAGARMTGAGFGGCFVCLIGTERADAWWRALRSRHPGSVRIA